MREVLGYAATHPSLDLRPILIERREPAADEVVVDILYCGICHTDVHQVQNEWKNTLYPCVPGHEIVGRVTAVGSDVSRIHVDEIVGVGSMIDSCGRCKNCREGFEQYCEAGFLATCNGNARHPTEMNQTYGGYSQSIVVRDDFVFHIPAGIEPAYAAPIMCAGVTTYSALRHWKAGPGVHVGTVPVPHDPNVYMDLLRRDGVYAVVGCLLPLKKAVDVSRAGVDRKSLATSLSGGVAETQDVLDFCALKNVLPEVRIITIDEVNQAFRQVDKGEIDFRYVIDMKTLAGHVNNDYLRAKVGL